MEGGKGAFREQNMPVLQNVLAVVQTISTVQIRLLMASSSRRLEILDSSIYLATHHPWVVSVYQDAVDKITRN